jgi:hypothetical protein
MPSSDSEVDGTRLAWAIEKLGRAFPASFPTPEKTQGVAALWRELLDRHPWITQDVFLTAVYAIAWKHKGGFLPEPATALEYFRAALQERRREGEQALPPPPKPGGPDDPAQVSAKEAARAYLRARGLWARRGFSAEEVTAALRAPKLAPNGSTGRDPDSWSG